MRGPCKRPCATFSSKATPSLSGFPTLRRAGGVSPLLRTNNRGLTPPARRMRTHNTNNRGLTPPARRRNEPMVAAKTIQQALAHVTDQRSFVQELLGGGAGMGNSSTNRAHRRHLASLVGGRVARPRFGASAGRGASLADSGDAARAAVGHLPAPVCQRRSFQHARRPSRRHRHPAAGSTRLGAVASPRLRLALLAARTLAFHLHPRLYAIPLRLLQGAQRKHAGRAAGEFRLEPGRYAPAHRLRV